MSAQIIDGKKLAELIRQKLKTALTQKSKAPGLAVVMVGAHAASQIYVKSKEKAALECGFYSQLIQLPETISQAQLLEQIQNLNQDSRIHGILVQLPLPAHLDAQEITQAILPEKDVDGFHPINLGKMLLGDDSALVSCTPLGVIKLLESTAVSMAGKHAVVVGRSAIVGKPVAQLLLKKNATVTVAHSQTQDLGAITRLADILVVAAGRPKLIKADMIKKDAVVIDVGIHRQSDGKICGDVDFESAKELASWITPVPGGVGPMTIACLLENTYQAAFGERL